MDRNELAKHLGFLEPSLAPWQSFLRAGNHSQQGYHLFCFCFQHPTILQSWNNS